MTATLASPFKQTRPPAWADGWGQDEFGYYAEFGINTGRKYWDFVTQRMRWIPPGTFMMGSPADESDRDDDEILHEVTITSGYWLADMACRQELWQAVMGNNPSRFQGDTIKGDGFQGESQNDATRPDPLQSARLPVELVSYEDAGTFFQKVAHLKPQLELKLPTEAQWEYACRAGTSSPFSFGRNIMTTQANYDGNYPYDGAGKGEYRRSTIACDALPPNPWGLFQMHGNVWEWCHDWYGEYDAVAATDPTGPESGSYRVVRGGSWFDDARRLRSACRGRDEPGDRYYALGFRCVSSVQ